MIGSARGEGKQAGDIGVGCSDEERQCKAGVDGRFEDGQCEVGDLGAVSEYDENGHLNSDDVASDVGQPSNAL